MERTRCTLAQARRAWLARQRLDDTTAKASVAASVGAIGWVPLTSPATAYLSLWSRGVIHTRSELDEAVFARGDLSIVPGPQGVPHLVPTVEAPIARAFAVADHASREARVAASAELTARQLSSARDAIRAALASPKTAEELAASLPVESVRPLGDVGKKNGVPTPAALVLRALWAAGEVAREYEEQRLDGARVRWVLEARPKVPLSAADAVTRVAQRWIAAHAPVRLRAFSGAFGLAAGRASAALAGLGLGEVDVEGLEGAHLVPADFSVPVSSELSVERVHLLPLRDPLTEVHLGDLASPSAARAATTKQHGVAPVVLLDGEVRALWSYDEIARLVTWRPVPDATIGSRERDRIDEAALRLTRFITAELHATPLHSPPALARPRPGAASTRAGAALALDLG